MANKTNNKGGRKGGTRYPKISLEKAVGYAKRLVSKTHTSAQPASVVKPGVFDSNTWLGDLRLSGTKQYGFVEGDSKAYSASELAKKINASPKDELPTLLMTACLKPKIFNTLHKTFHGETVNTAKLKQQALNSGVHPENAEECVNTFIESLVFCGLATITDSDKIEINSQPTTIVEDNEESELLEDNNEEQGSEIQNTKPEEQPNKAIPKPQMEEGTFQMNKKKGASNINVNIDIDPSMDPEKLEKLLKLLKGYGAI